MSFDAERTVDLVWFLRRLGRAVILRAEADLSDPEHADDALRWFASDSTAARSFRWWCDRAGWSPELVRQRIRV